MFKTIGTLTLMLMFCTIAAAGAKDHPTGTEHPSSKKENPAPGADAQVKSLEEMCQANADARAGRQAMKSLYERLGKDEKINAITAEVVRLHLVNDAIKHLVDARYADHLAKRVADYMIAGTGGPDIYGGPSLKNSHEHMKLSNADFMAAGGDVIQAMKNLRYGQDEIDEVVCILVSLRDQVVLKH